MATPCIRLGVALCCFGLAGCATTTKGKDADADKAPVVPDYSMCEGRPVEVAEEFAEDGVLLRREHYVVDDNGEQIAHGLTEFFWENGQKKLSITYNCGYKNGMKRTWYRDGSKWSEGGHVDGLEDGRWTTWYQDGTKMREFTLKRGAWHGLHTLWHPNGMKKMEVQYVDGLRQGPFTIWDPAGTVLKRIDYVDGIEQPMPGR